MPADLLGCINALFACGLPDGRLGENTLIPSQLEVHNVTVLVA